MSLPPPNQFDTMYDLNSTAAAAAPANYYFNNSSIPPPPPPLLGVPLFDRDMSPPRKRTRTSPEQLAVLEKSFSTNPSPNNRIREQLSHQLGMPERSIQIWFQNRRAKVKNQQKRTHYNNDTLYMQQQYAASAAAAACQSVQQTKDGIDPNLYYYYYYYYFHQQQQQQTTNKRSSAPATSMGPPELTMSASTSSTSSSSHRHVRSSSASSSERSTRAHSVGPYPYRKSQEPRQTSLGPTPTPTLSSSFFTNTIMEEQPPFIHSTTTQFSLNVQTLQIGSWKRVCDLDCQIDLASRNLVWRISDKQQLQQFRMDISLNLVQYIKLYANRMEFYLSSPNVKFYMTNGSEWIQCHDFTQDRQASSEQVHILEGNQVEFMQILMQAPELQNLVIQETAVDQNLLLLQGF